MTATQLMDAIENLIAEHPEGHREGGRMPVVIEYDGAWLHLDRVEVQEPTDEVRVRHWHGVGEGTTVRLVTPRAIVLFDNGVELTETKPLDPAPD